MAMATSKIADLVEDIYGVGFSKGVISTVTDKIIPPCFKNGRQDLLKRYSHLFFLMLFIIK